MQHFVVTGLAANVHHAQTRIAQLFQLFNGFMTHIARQAVGGDALHIRQMRVNGVQYGHQPTRGQRHCIAIGHKDAAHRHPTRSDIAQVALDFVLRAWAKFFLRRGVHLAKRTLIPRATIGHG